MTPSPHPPVRREFPTRASTLWRSSTFALLALLGCYSSGERASGDRAGQPNGKFQISPATATVIAGQRQSFVASSPWGSGATWTVLPSTGGTCDSSGNFTASSTLGQYQIVAMLDKDVRYTATATVFVVAPPGPSRLNPNLVQGYGTVQTSTSGLLRNRPVVGEPVPARTATTAGGTEQVRHGFDPTVPR